MTGGTAQREDKLKIENERVVTSWRIMHSMIVGLLYSVKVPNTLYRLVFSQKITGTSACLALPFAVV